METLVLSATYEPVARVSWQRAITLLWQSKVEVIDEYADREIRAVSVTIKMPSVIRFVRALRSRRRAVKFSRENVYMRDGGRCQYCGARVTRFDATYDHVLPRKLGGLTTWENIVIACVACNQRKGGRTPESAHMTPRSRPVKPAKLPDTFRLTLAYQPGMPASWRQWLRDFDYWNTELDNDNHDG